MNRIKEIRKSKNLSQVDVAKALNVKKQFLNNIENGYKALSLSFAVEIADYFDVSLDELVGRERKKEQEKE